MARNFAEEQFNILYPRIDWRRNTTGHVESEFPVYQFVVATLYRAVGVAEWLARCISIAFMAIAIVYLALLIRRLSDEMTALWSSAFFAVLPMPLFFGRAIMPESLLLAGCLGCAYHFARWLEDDRLPSLVVATGWLAIASLIKPFSLWLMLPLLVLAGIARWRALARRWEIWAALLVAVGLSALWFSHAHRLAEETGLSFGVWTYATDKWGTWQLTFSAEFWSKLLLKRFPKDYLAWAGVVPFVIGATRVRHARGHRFFLAWIVALLTMSAVVSRGTYSHDYYWLPMAVPVAFFLGCAYSGFQWRRAHRSPGQAVLALCLIGTVTIGARAHLGRLEEERLEAEAYADLVSLVETTVPPPIRVIALDEGNPLMLYMVHRKGWHAERQADSRYINSAARRGARFLIGFREDASTVRHPRILKAIAKPAADVRFAGKAVVVPLRLPQPQESSSGHGEGRTIPLATAEAASASTMAPLRDTVTDQRPSGEGV